MSPGTREMGEREVENKHEKGTTNIFLQWRMMPVHIGQKINLLCQNTVWFASLNSLSRPCPEFGGNSILESEGEIVESLDLLSRVR